MRIVVSVTNNLITDQRVHRVCQSLHNHNNDVILVGRSWPEAPMPLRNYKVRRLNLIFRKKFLFYAEYNIRLFFFLLFNKADVLVANDLDTLPANYCAARIKRCQVFFDSHEYFPETPEVYNRPFVKKIWETAEKMFVKGCHRYYTVSDSLASVYYQKYGLAFQVIRNVPLWYPFPEPSNAEGNLILYQGSVNVGRGLELMIRAMKLLPHMRLVIAGNGPELMKLKQLAYTCEVDNQVEFTGLLVPEELRELTVKASVGISLEEATGLSYISALPNKVFDYIQAGVPVLVSDLPEMKALVNKYNAGMILEERTPENLAFTLNLMLHDKVKRAEWKKNLAIAAGELCWENEEPKLLGLFE